MASQLAVATEFEAGELPLCGSPDGDLICSWPRHSSGDERQSCFGYWAGEIDSAKRKIRFSVFLRQCGDRNNYLWRDRELSALLPKDPWRGGQCSHLITTDRAGSGAEAVIAADDRDSRRARALKGTAKALSDGEECE